MPSRLATFLTPSCPGRRAAWLAALACAACTPVSPLARQAAMPKRLIISGHRVVAMSRCPDWSKPDAADGSNTPPSNFGCATLANLAAMVADPADLVAGRQPGLADGGFAARGVELYRAGALPGLVDAAAGGNSSTSQNGSTGSGSSSGSSGS